MADARILHKRGSHGERVASLSHLEFRVWVQYLLSADDYGVMRASSSVVRADNPNLEREPLKRIDAAMSSVEGSGLVQVFTHQGARFWWQLDWQDFQNVRYPRETVNPAPPSERIREATKRQQDLFGVRLEQARRRSRADSEMSPTPAGAGGRQTLTPTLTLTAESSGSAEEKTREVENRGGHYTPVNPHSRPGNLVNAAEQRAHGMHAWCDYQRGMCVPYGLDAEFRKRLGGTDAAERLKRWYPAVVASHGEQAIGDGMFDFWRNEFGAWVGTVTAAPIGKLDKAERVMKAAERVIAGQLGRKAVADGR